MTSKMDNYSLISIKHVQGSSDLNKGWCDVFKTIKLVSSLVHSTTLIAKAKFRKCR